jgi:hypothetical protein
MSHSRAVLLRDLVIFQVKLLLDGMKDIVLMPVTIGAAALDMLFPGPRPGHRFYLVISMGERFDRGLNLFAAAERADASKDGLFAGTRAERDTLLGRIEDIVLGPSDRPGRGGRPADG